MNGNSIKRSSRILSAFAVLSLVQLLSTDLEARDLVWRRHAATNQGSQGTTLHPSSARKPQENIASRANESTQSANTEPAVVALHAENAEITRDIELKPIPVAKYQNANGRRQNVAPVSFNGKPAGRPVYPEGPIYPPSNMRPQPLVQPWHPDALYASSGAAAKAARLADASVLTPEPATPEAVTPEIAGSEEILPEDLGPGEILIPDGTDPMEVGAFSDGCCPDCGVAPCGCDPDWGYPLPEYGTVCIPFLRPTLEFVDFSIGAESFAGPGDQGVNHNYGFNETVNLSGSWLDGWVGWQVGARFVQADFNGMMVLSNGRLSNGRIRHKDDIRHQEFLTVGLFHRATEFQPWQGGIAADFMEDHFYYKTDLTQLRVEVSRRMWWRLDFGTWLVFRGDSEKNVEEYRPTIPTPTIAEYQAANQYTLFLQWAFPNGGEARIYGGGGNDRDGIIGGYFWSPLSHSIAVTGNFGYLFSGKKNLVPGTAITGGVPYKSLEDSYGLSLNVAWYPHRRARIGSRNPYRALFPVANNGTFFVKRNGVN
ncbi:MAG: DUF6666 family protein [Planctomycetota bacterium]|nr:DUF6666 family protein [Planctomycetota bacterium]